MEHWRQKPPADIKHDVPANERRQDVRILLRTWFVTSQDFFERCRKATDSFNPADSPGVDEDVPDTVYEDIVCASDRYVHGPLVELPTPQSNQLHTRPGLLWALLCFS